MITIADTHTCQDSGKDSDADGMPDWWEIKYGLNPNSASDASMDSDGDGMTNLEEYNYFKDNNRDINPKKADTDGDGAPDGLEVKANTNPIDPNSRPSDVDSDGDGMPDDWERAHGLNPNDPLDANLDNDNDGLSNFAEYRYLKTVGKEIDPNKADTDGDGFNDKAEIDAGTDPTDSKSYPRDDKDTDMDGMPDWWEKKYNLDPNDPNDATGDPDGDGLTNLEEYNHFNQNGQDMDPHKNDTDGDSYLDGEEVLAGSNQLTK